MINTDRACADCGYHVCSCPEPELPPCPPCPNCGHEHRYSACGRCECKSERPPTIKARIDTLERFRELGMLDTPGQREAVFRMLLDGDYSGFGVKP